MTIYLENYTDDKKLDYKILISNVKSYCFSEMQILYIDDSLLPKKLPLNNNYKIEVWQNEKKF